SGSAARRIARPPVGSSGGADHRLVTVPTDANHRLVTVAPRRTAPGLAPGTAAARRKTPFGNGGGHVGSARSPARAADSARTLSAERALYLYYSGAGKGRVGQQARRCHLIQSAPGPPHHRQPELLPQLPALAKLGGTVKM